MSETSTPPTRRLERSHGRGGVEWNTGSLVQTNCPRAARLRSLQPRISCYKCQSSYHGNVADRNRETRDQPRGKGQNPSSFDSVEQTRQFQPGRKGHNPTVHQWTRQPGGKGHNPSHSPVIAMPRGKGHNPGSFTSKHESHFQPRGKGHNPTVHQWTRQPRGIGHIPSHSPVNAMPRGKGHNPGSFASKHDH